MTNKHPYADILKYLIDGGDVNNIEAKRITDDSWDQSNTAYLPHLLKGNTKFSFRIKPKTVMFNGLELPMYETSPLKYDDKYYMPEVKSDEFVNSCRWFSDDLDTKRLNRGLVFLKQEDAVVWGKAMCPRSS